MKKENKLKKHSCELKNESECEEEFDEEVLDLNEENDSDKDEIDEECEY